MRHIPVLSDLELRILGLVRDEARSGYAIRKALGASPGAVYPAVRRLVAAGLLSGKSEATGERKRETLAITTAGRRALRETLDRPTIEDVRRDAESVAARIRFLDGSAAIAFLEEFARLCVTLATDRKRESGLLADYESAMFAARARWASAAAKRLRNG